MSALISAASSLMSPPGRPSSTCCLRIQLRILPALITLPASGPLATPNKTGPSKSCRRQRLSCAGEPPAQPPLTSPVCASIAREQKAIRGRSDLRRAHRARHPDPPARVLRLGLASTLEADFMKRRDHRSPGRLLQTRRTRPTSLGCSGAAGEPTSLPTRTTTRRAAGLRSRAGCPHQPTNAASLGTPQPMWSAGHLNKS